MPARSNEFQKLVLRIYKALGGTGATVEESVLVKEKNSDARREVDLLVTTSIAGHQTRMAIECRDHGRQQNLTWIDGLIGKYANLGIEKVVAISATEFSATAKQKATQHNIELLTLRQAVDTDWAGKTLPSSLQFFGFRNRPLIVGLKFEGNEQLKIEYTFEGDLNSTDKSLVPLGQFFLEVWQAHMGVVAGRKMAEYVFSDWDRVSSLPKTPRYWELTETFTAPRSLGLDGSAPIPFDTIIWGVGTKYAMDVLEPKKLVLGEKAAAVAQAFDDLGKSFHITLVSNEAGQLVGADVTTPDA